MTEFHEAVEALTDPVPEGFAREFQISTIYRPLPADFMNRVIAESLKLPARVWRAVMVGMLATERPDRLGGDPFPTLVLWGDRDAVFLQPARNALAALLPAATVKSYPETGHAPHWERPAEFVRDLGEFMAWTAEE